MNATSEMGVASEWVGVGEARRIAGLRYQALRQLIDAGRITVRTLSFSHPMILRSDIERLVAESTIPARREVRA